MSEAPSKSPGYFHTLLILGSVSNLPTVWSNCLAGWWLGGAGDAVALAVLLVAATLMYTGGMFLNDACDAEFDRRHRRERPIPLGAISEREVWTCALSLLGLGAAMLVFVGRTTGVLGLLLLASIILYDVLHKRVSLSPVMMALCRFFLFLAAASAGAEGVNGFAVWCAVVLAGYIVGLTYIAKFESVPGLMRFWPCVLVASPLVLAWVANAGPFRVLAWIWSMVLFGWVVWSLWHTYGREPKAIGKTVCGLLAGIVLVDALAIVGGPPAMTITLVVFFLLALVFQRYVPAT